MNHRLHKGVILAILAISLISTGCREGPTSSADANSVSIVNAATGQPITTAQTKRTGVNCLRTEVLDAGAAVAWKSSDNNLATVDNLGRVTFKEGASGVVIITATPLGGGIARTVTYVLDPTACGPTTGGNNTCTGVTFSPQNSSGAAGSTLQLTVNMQGTGCAPHFFSSGPSRVGVHPTTGLVSFIAPGTETVCVQPTVPQTWPQFCGSMTTTGTTSQQPTITGVTLSVSPNPVTQCPSTVTITAAVQGTGSFNSVANLAASSGAVVQTGTNTWTWQATQSGSVTFTATAAGDATKTTPVVLQINCQQNQTPAVTITGPGTFNCIAGQTFTYTPSVVATGGASSAITWTLVSSNPTGAAQVLVNWNQQGQNLTGNCLASGVVNFRATSNQFPSVQHNVVGTIGAGQVTCTVNGQSGATFSFTLAMNANQGFNLVCTNQFGATILPFGHSSNPARVQFRGTQQVVINGQTFWAGFTFNANRIATGQTTLTIQAEIDNPTPIWVATVN